MKTEEEIKTQLETQKQLLSECKGRGCGINRQKYLRAIEMLVWVLS